MPDTVERIQATLQLTLSIFPASTAAVPVHANMESLEKDALWSCVVVWAATWVTCAICTCVIVRSHGYNGYHDGGQSQRKDFSKEHKKALRELLVRTRSPSDQDIAYLLTQREFAAEHITRLHVRRWFQRTNLLVDKLIGEAAGEMIAVRDGGLPATGGADIITSTAGRAEEMVAHRCSEITRSDRMDIRGGEIAQRWKDL